MYLKFMKRLLLTIDEKEGSENAGGDGKEETVENKTMDDLLAQAEKDFARDHPELSGDEKTEEKPEEKKEEKEEEEKDEEEDLNDEEKVHAKTLFRLLKNPETSRQALESLARSAGLDLKEVETKKEEREAKATVKDLVKEKLGDDYKFLADKLGDILQDLFDTQVKEQTKDIREKIADSEIKARVSEIKSAQDEVISTYKEVPAEILKEVLRISKTGELIQGKDISDAKFFKSCLVVAAENLGVALVKKTESSSKTQETRTTKRSPLDEISSKSRPSGSQKETPKVTQVKSISDALNLAVEQLASKK